MNVAGYIRVSGGGQVDKEGPRRQRDVISAFCSSNGLTRVGNYFDAGVSGTVDSMDRPQFVRMVKDIIKRRAIYDALSQKPHALRIDGVVIEKVDRLARTLAVQEAAVLQLRKQGIKLFIVSMGTLQDYAADSGDPSLNLFRQMLGAIAEFDKVNMCARLSQARAAVRLRKGRCEGRKPFGEKPGEAEVLAWMKDMRKTKTSYREISCRLNEKNHSNRSGNPWTMENVKRVLNPDRNKPAKQPVSFE